VHDDAENGATGAARVLIVDDDASIRSSLAEALGEAGYDVATAESGTRALDLLHRAAPEVMLTDVRMDGMDGLELLRAVRERGVDTDVVLMTAYDDMPTVVAAMRGGAAEFLVKPLRLEPLLAVLQRVLEDRRLRTRAKRPSAAGGLQDLVGRDPRMVEVYKAIGQAAMTRATVLIRGESGTGKELIARAIHTHSETAREPFVAVNCAALPANLLESELFGHVRGAFTGAVNARRGAFAQAGAGTIFLDEIGDTTADFQTRLLRVLQNREFQPVGSERIERTQARVVAATHRNLEEMRRDGRFREDLYYRLRVLEITVPPLRERRGDIRLLARHLVSRSAAGTASGEPLLSPEALQYLERQHWPGNVRELENVLLRAVTVASGGVIRPEHLHREDTPAAEQDADATQSLAENEREHVRRVLASVGGHKSRAAKLLGISRPRLDRLLTRHGLK
jgi:DNA-binding NtrC family response regulator